MRALDPRRPPIFPRFFVSFALLLFVVHICEPRSVRENGDPVPSAGRSAIDKHEEVNAESVSVDSQRLASEQHDSGSRVQGSSPEDHRVRGELGGSQDEKVVSEEIITSDEQASVVGGTRRNVDDSGTSESSEVLKQEDEESSVAKKRRRNDVALSGKPEVEAEAKDEAIRRFDVQIDTEGVPRPSVKNEPRKSEEIRVSEIQDEVPGSFRQSGKLDEVMKNEEDASRPEESREFRSFAESQGKSKRKSSTVYLSAEEKKISDGEQQSIVEGQIKKLISIRDGALDAQKDSSDPKLVVGVDEVAITHEEIRDEDRKSGRAQNLQQFRLLTPDAVIYNILQDALQTYPRDETSVSYIDPNNDTLNKLLTPDQLAILQMAEKFLPEALRRDYSEKMFSCVRRFEYFSCVKYFAWPLVKQYFPALPAFPDYQSWYPIVDLSPHYPIFPFPGSLEDVGELPEVVDADGTRARKPRPEVVIFQVLQNTLKEQQSRTSTSQSFLDQSSDTHVALIPEDQLLTINLAEQLLPISYRPEFVQKTVRCMKEYNYLSCFKYSAWPTVRRFIPTLPDISRILPDFHAQAISDIGAYVPQISTYPDLRFYLPVNEAPIREASTAQAYVTLKKPENLLKTSDELEIKIIDILLKMRKSLEKDKEMFMLAGNAVTFTKRQIDILQLAECLIPSSARSAFVSEILAYLQKNDNFIDSARQVIWPTLSKYVPSLPEFPALDIFKERIDVGAQETVRTKESTIAPGETVQERGTSDSDKIYSQDKESRNRVPDVPVISVSGTRFVPIFTEHPESVILNILRSVQLQSFKTTSTTQAPTIKNQQFLDYLTEQQVNIINIVDSLLPESSRPDFANKMIDCLRVNNFLICTRDVIWPVLTGYFPWLPNFPNFGIVANTPATANSSTTLNQNITEHSASSDASPLSETDVKTGQHGDTTVTITDTRFFPIYNELPETIILNILKAVHLSIPNLPASSAPLRTQDYSGRLTEQQINIVQIAENLLPIPVRSEFIDRINSCTKERNFLECTRDITWPMMAQFYPWLPSFPNFGTLQNLPQASSSNSIRFQVFLSEKPTPNPESQKSSLREAEEKIQNALSNVLKETPDLDRSYLNVTDSISSVLTPKQMDIIKLVEKGLPEAARLPYVTKMTECASRYSFLACTNSISWPTLMQYVPSLPDLSNIIDFGSNLSTLSSITIGPPSIPLPQSPLRDQRSLQYSQRPDPRTTSPGNLEIKITGNGPLISISQLSPIFPQQIGVYQLEGNKDQTNENVPLSNTLHLLATSQGSIGLQQLAELIDSKKQQKLPFQGTFNNRFDETAASIPTTTPQPANYQGPIELQELLQNWNSNVPPLASSPDLLATSQRPAGLQQKPQELGGLVTQNSLNDQRQESKINESSPITPSVGNEGVPGYAGQPPGIPLDISGERITSGKRQTETKDSRPPVAKARKRRSATGVPSSRYDTEYTSDEIEPSASSVDEFPNVTESEYLRMLIKIRERRKSFGANLPKPKRYTVDALNSTVRNNLTADQYEILKAVDDLDDQSSGKGIASQVIQCITGLSFIRCVGIFVWPLIVNNLPLPSFPSFGFFGRSLETENKVQDFFGMSTDSFERELLERRDSIEGFLLDWYRKLVEEKFQMDVGLFKIKGYGNSELGISVSGFREGRGAKIKDNKNLPSILTIISDIMEEVLDQRPEGEKPKKDKEKKERSIDDSRESYFQFLKDSEEYVDIRRSMNDQEIITMFLDRIRANDSDYGDDGFKYFTADDAYNAFEVLFGTKLHDKLGQSSPKEVDIVSLDSEKDAAELKVLPLNGRVTYDLEKESARDQENRQREKRAKNFFKSFLEKRPDKYFKDHHIENFEHNKITEERRPEDGRSSLILKLPSLHDEFLSRMVTDSVVRLSRGLKSKMTQMMPGLGLIFTFLLQTALAHARTAASVAGMLSNVALGSAMFGMVRDSLMGSNDHPKIKYVYDNDKMGPGITWPSRYEPHYYG
ncbi:uncharacterized protein LOC108627584 [Ceratina calcarata]|uniref:Uncharacterized protein LOC108627584 n=1 Tax=Ceratina calcarata TaxID=156304 RepID=A0AAJ7WDR2_9HYME|nr:uncharacterized protein LOC108627584 [Ceratina calcarata]